jgi:hypothetical protein
MMRGLAFVGIVGVLATGCLWERRPDRPARFNAGPNMRAVNVAAPDNGRTPGTARSTTGEPDANTDRVSAMTASLQFTMSMGKNVYAGGEAETGKLALPGSWIAGAYGIVGAEAATRRGALGAELAAGWRGVRTSLDEGDDEDQLVLEPRVRAQLWFAEQWTLGGAVGTRLGGEGEWMAGVYIGVHSAAF